MKLIGIDYGDARVGIASSDRGGRIASSVCVLKVSGIENAAALTAAKAKELDGELLVVGRPVTTAGQDGYRVQRTERFAELLRKESGHEVVFYDERFSSLEASRYLSEGNVYGAKRKKVLDAVAAQIILQAYIDASDREQKDI